MFLTVLLLPALIQCIDIVVPRWISANNYGRSLVITSFWNGTSVYEAETMFSWDFDYNCMREYYHSYVDPDIYGEWTRCNGT